MKPTSFNFQTKPNSKKRNLKKVPFVELHNNRLQGVVSAGSSKDRVYVSFFEAKSLDFCCSTNNNRPCGGLSAHSCKHLNWLVEEAVKQYGASRIADYLKISNNPEEFSKANDIFKYLQGSYKKEPAAEVFSRFLQYLSYLETKPVKLPISEISWFI